MAVFPGWNYSQLPQYHDGRAAAWEEPRDERMVGVHGDRGRDDVDREIPVLGRVVGSTGNIALDAREPQTVAAPSLEGPRRGITNVPIVTNRRLDPFERF